jgi:hypothetical protein
MYKEFCFVFLFSFKLFGFVLFFVALGSELSALHLLYVMYLVQIRPLLFFPILPPTPFHD